MKWNKINESGKFNESAVSDYKINQVEVRVIAKFDSKRWKVDFVLEKGKCQRAFVQLATAQYGTDPWIGWFRGKKDLKLGGEVYGIDHTGTWKLEDNPEFRSWLEGIVRDIESKFA